MLLMIPLHATVLQHISLGRLRLENNIEGERLQVTFCLVHLLTKIIYGYVEDDDNCDIDDDD